MAQDPAISPGTPTSVGLQLPSDVSSNGSSNSSNSKSDGNSDNGQHGLEEMPDFVLRKKSIFNQQVSTQDVGDKPRGLNELNVSIYCYRFTPHFVMSLP